jgi:seryl-tRNA synthetase
MATKSPKSTELMKPDPQLIAIKTKATKLLAKWSKPIVKTAEQFEAAGDGVKDINALRKELKTKVWPSVADAKKTYDDRRKAFNAVDKLLEGSEDGLREALEDYNDLHRRAQEARVEEALKSGKDEKAASIATKPYVPDVVGLSFTDHWHAEVRSLPDLIRAVLSGQVEPDAILPDMVFLNGKARTAKSEDIGVPGVVGVKETNSSIRS